MKILGLNAYHADASACLVIDGRLVAAAEEERFTRVKHWAGLPVEAIRSCLEQAGLTLEAVDHIAINRRPRAHLYQKILFTLAHHPSFQTIRDRLRNAGHVQDLKRELAAAWDLEPEDIRAPIHRVEHHRAHLASAFYVSPFDSAALLSVDGFGDFVSTMAGEGKGRTIKTVNHVAFPHSLGLLYLALTQYLGFHAYGDEYKVMGLAAYGDPEFLPELRTLVTLQERGRFALTLDYFLHHSEGVPMVWSGGAPTINQVFSPALVDRLGPARNPDEPITPRHQNLAASLQALYEEAFFHVLEALAAQVSRDRLCLAGGCALNSVANGKILERTPFKEVYIPPAAGDAGGAVGAAFSVWHDLLKRPRSFVMDHAGWGPPYTDADYRKTLDAWNEALTSAGCRVTRMADEEALCRRTAELLAGGCVVGWFQGGMEWGARALGYRSILADPRRPEMKETLNGRIKHREPFRPFAPSILEEAVGDYFEQTAPSPFMTMTYRVRPEKRPVIPATTHVDGTGRLQTVTRESNDVYWKLIRAFYALTGVPVLLNTSFNEQEPIVRTPEDALACFLRTNMDALALGNDLITREGCAREGCQS